MTGSASWRVRRPRGLLARLALRTAVAGFLFFVVAGGAVVVVAARTSVTQVEDRLTTLAGGLASSPLASGDGETLCDLVASGLPGGLRSDSDVLVELRGPSGQVCRPADAMALEPVRTAPWVVRWLSDSDLQQVPSERGAPVLVLDRELPNGWTARLGADLTDLGVLAQRLLTTMLVLSVPGAFVAALSGYLLTRGGLRPVRELADVAETVARTQDLAVRVEVPQAPPGDEVARLAASFNRMVTALASARDRQNRLVADASHELRTPLTSLRTNLDLLVRSERAGRPLPDAERAALMDDVDGQLDELSTLVGSLLVLAHDGPPPARGEVRLDEVVERAVARARRRADGRRVRCEVAPWVVPDADAEALERAVVNLLDNALKFSPPGSTVRVAAAGGRVEVDDEGPGVAPADRERVFERFWRSDEARALPGTGLGLAIVADAVAAHGGTARVMQAPGGGTRAVLDLGGHAPG